MSETGAADLAARIAACKVCAAHLPHGVRPVASFSPTARLLIIGQAPGSKVHLSGIPWDDKSGDRLRGWTGLDRETMYDASQVALVPMGFCYPGKASGGISLFMVASISRVESSSTPCSRFGPCPMPRCGRMTTSSAGLCR